MHGLKSNNGNFQIDRIKHWLKSSSSKLNWRDTDVLPNVRNKSVVTTTFFSHGLIT